MTDDPRGWFRARLAELLRASGFTQKRVAEHATARLAAHGPSGARVSDRALSDWKTGKSRPDTEPQLRAVLHVVLPRVTARVKDGVLDASTLTHGLRDEATWTRWYTAAVEADVPAATACGTVAAADPVRDLGVHRVAGADGDADVPLPAYLLRPHDEELRALLSLAADPDGPADAVMVVLTGESTVGKTRALWEAVCEVMPDWRLLRPATAAALIGMLTTGDVTEHTVLWHETQAFLHGGPGEEAAALLTETLSRTHRVVMVGAMWSNPYWTTLTTPGRIPDQRAVRELLTVHAHRIPVPATLDPGQRRDLAAVAGDHAPVEQALAAAARDGRVIQRLTGGPELLAAYRESDPADRRGGPFTAVEHALITAAVDARRLGHAEPLGPAFLVAAADAYLEDWDRLTDRAAVAEALGGLASGRRLDGRRTDVRTVTALTAHRARTGAVPAYHPDDYLLQHASRDRARHIPGPAFWDAALAHASAAACAALAYTASRRGLYRDAARLHKRTAAHPSSPGAHQLLAAPHLTADHRRLAEWLASHAAVTHLGSVVNVMNDLGRAGYPEQAAAIAARAIPVAELTKASAVAAFLRVLNEEHPDVRTAGLLSRIRADSARISGAPSDIVRLLRALHQAGAYEILAELAERLPDVWAKSETSDGLFSLLTILRETGASDCATRLAAGAAATIGLEPLRLPMGLVRSLENAGYEDQAATLRRRLFQLVPSDGTDEDLDSLPARVLIAGADFADPGQVSGLLENLQRLGADERVAALVNEELAAGVELADAEGLTSLVVAFKRLGADRELAVLMERDPVAQIDLTRAAGVAYLLEFLHPTRKARVLARALRPESVEAIDVADPRTLQLLRREQRPEKLSLKYRLWDVTERGEAPADDIVAFFNDWLKPVRADRQLGALLERDPATYAGLDDEYGVVDLLCALHEVRAGDQFTAFAQRVAEGVDATDVEQVRLLLRLLTGLEAHEQAAVLAGRATQDIELDRPGTVAILLKALRKSGLHEQAAALVARDPAGRAELTIPLTVRSLLHALAEAGARDQLAILAERVAAHVAITEGAVGSLLSALHRVGADEQAAVLTGRLERACRSGPEAAAWGWDDLD